MGRSKLFGWKRSVAQESGSQLVETALVLPIFLVVISAIAQYGLIFASYITLRHASAVGARQAIITVSNNTNLIASAAKGAVGPLLDSNLVGVTVTTNATVNGSVATTVRLSYPISLIIPYVVPPFTGGATRTRTITATTIIQ